MASDNLMADDGSRYPIPTAARISLSFVSTFIGLCCAYVTLVLWQASAIEEGINDFEFMLFYPAIYVFAGWLIFVVPIVSRVDHRHRMFRPDCSVIFGVGWGIVAFIVLTGLTGLWPLWTEGYLVGFAAIVGGAMLLTYAIAVQHPRVQAWAQGPYFSVVTVSIPILFLLSSVLLWPTIERVFPAVSYRYGSAQTRNRVEGHVVRGIRVGDRFEDLHRKLPDLFVAPTALSSGRGDGFSYTILFKDGQVSSIEIKNED